MPPPRTFQNDRWTIGTPDLVVSNPVEVTVPAVGADWWPEWTVDPGLTEDRWIKAVEIKPSPAGQKVVHHAGASAVFPGGDDDDTGIGGWSLYDFFTTRAAEWHTFAGLDSSRS